MTKLFGKKMHFGAYFLQNPCIFEKKKQDGIVFIARMIELAPPKETASPI
jgi:hypothetical protein